MAPLADLDLVVAPPGSLVILRVPADTPLAEIHETVQSLRVARDWRPEDVAFVVARPGVTIEHLTEQEMGKRGWCRCR